MSVKCSFGNMSLVVGCNPGSLCRNSDRRLSHAYRLKQPKPNRSAFMIDRSYMAYMVYRHYNSFIAYRRYNSYIAYRHFMAYIYYISFLPICNIFYINIPSISFSLDSLQLIKCKSTVELMELLLRLSINKVILLHT